MKQQAVRVNDDESDGMGAAGYVAVVFVAGVIALLIAAVLWLPVLYRAAGRGLP